MAKLTIDLSGRGGLVNNTGQSTRAMYDARAGQVLSGTWNPLLRKGYMSPANGTADACSFDNSPTAQLKAKIYDPINDDFYIAENARQLWKGDGMADTSLTRSIQLAASSGLITDLNIYTVNDVRKLFVLYEDNANTAEICISSLPYDTATDNETWTATVGGDAIGGNSLLSNSQHMDFFMENADNGFAYLFMANQVHKLDGTASGGANGTMTANALLFPTSFQIVDAIDRGGLLYIALHQYVTDTRSPNPTTTVDGNVQCGVYVWDRQSTVTSATDYIPLPGVSEISKLFVGANGHVRAIAKTAVGLTVIYELSGTSWRAIQAVGYNAFPVNRDAVEAFGTMVSWFGKDGVYYMYGSAYTDWPEALYQMYSTAVATTTAGLVMSSKGSSSTAPAVYLGYQSSTPTITLSRLQIPTLTGQSVTSDMAASTNTFPLQFLPQMSTVNSIEVYCAAGTATGSTTAASIKVYFNGSSTAWATKTVTLDQVKRGYVHIPVSKKYVNSIQVEVVYPATTDLGTSDFAPAFAVVDYTPSVTSGVK